MTIFYRSNPSLLLHGLLQTRLFRLALVSLCLLTATSTALFAQINATLRSTVSTCQANGTVTVSGVSGGTPPYQAALISGPGVTAPVYMDLIDGAYTFINLWPGTYEVNVTDGVIATTFSIAVTGNYVVANYNVTPSLNACAGGAQTGKIVVSGITGGLAPYRYRMTQPTTTPLAPVSGTGVTIDNLVPGQEYELQVWDACDNFQTRQVRIPEKTVPSINGPTVEYLGCTGAVSATFTTTGATSPFAFSVLSGPANDPAVGTSNTTGVFAFQPNSTYTVGVQDACGARNTTTVVRQGLPPLEAYAYGGAGSGCEPGSTGGTYVFIKGGITPYRSAVIRGVGGCAYGPTTLTNLRPDGDGFAQIVMGLPRPCQYELVVTDACNNVVTRPFEMSAPAPGALGVYEYYNCPANNGTEYQVTIGADYGPPYAPTAPFSVTLLTANGTPVAGFPKVIPNFQNETTVSLPAGAYTYQLADGCGITSRVVSISVSAYQKPLLTENLVNACIGAGRVILMGTNRNPFKPNDGTYSIISGPSQVGDQNFTGVFSNLVSGGTYVFGFNDGCQTVTLEGTIPPYEQPTFEVGFGAICPPATLGNLQAFNLGPANVVRPYTFEIIALGTTGGLTRPPQLDSLFSDLGPGDYNVRGIDACNNSFTFLGKIGVMPMPVIRASRGPYCVGQPLRIRVAQPVYRARYTYFLNGQQVLSTTSITTNIPAQVGQYSVLVTTADGCTALSNMDFDVLLTGRLTAVSPLTGCAGKTIDLTDPAITAGSDAGTLSYFQDAAGTVPLDASTGPANAIIKPGDYYIKLTSSVSCSAITKVSLSFTSSFTASLSSGPVCAGQPITLTATGGSTYDFGSGISAQNTITVSPTATTVYSVTAYSAQNCPNSPPASGTVTALTHPVVTITTVSCVGVTYTASFTATAGATIRASAGVVAGNQVTGIPSGQPISLTATLGTCQSTATNPGITCVLPASLGDQTFVDTNGDGIQNNGEPVLADVVVTLLSNGVVIATATTNASGLYSFTGLVPGTPYSVSFTAPAGYTATTFPAGSSNAVTLASGENNLTIDAGFKVITPRLVLSKRVSSSTAQLGSVVSYTVTLVNTGPIAATSVVVSDTYTAGISPVAGSYVVSTGTFTPTAGGGNWSITTLPVNATATLTYSASLTSNGVAYNTASLPDQPAVTATACTSVPFNVCEGVPFAIRLTAPTGYTRYQWTLTAPGATTTTVVYDGPLNSYTATAPGQYAILVEDGAFVQCPQATCCPILIETISVPAYSLVAVSPTCMGSEPQPNGQVTLSGLGASPGAVYDYQLALAGATAFPAATAVPANGSLAQTLAAGTYTVRVIDRTTGCTREQSVVVTAPNCVCPPLACAPFVVKRSR